MNSVTQNFQIAGMRSVREGGIMDEEWWCDDDDAPSDEGDCIPPSPPRRRTEVLNAFSDPPFDEILSSDDDDVDDAACCLVNRGCSGQAKSALSTFNSAILDIDGKNDGENHRDRIHDNDEGDNARKIMNAQLGTIRKSTILRGRHCHEGPNSSSSAAVSFSSSPLLEGRWSSPMIIDESNPEIPAAAARVARFEASLGGRTTPNQLNNDNAQYEHDNSPSCRNMFQRSRRRNQLDKQQCCHPKQITSSMSNQANTAHTIKDNESTSISSSLHPSFTLISLSSDRKVRNSRSQNSRLVLPTTQTVEITTGIDRHPSNSGTSSSSSIIPQYQELVHSRQHQ